MQIEIKEVISKRDWDTFIFLPERIHKDHITWVPPLYIDEKKFFDKNKNPAFKSNQTILFLAFRGKTPVGRVMGIIPTEFNATQGYKTARFSYLECYEDKAVFDALLHSVEKWALQYDCELMVGPMGFSDKEPQGFVTKGFGEPPMPVTNHNFSFMKDFIEQSGYLPYVELCQYDIPINREMFAKYKPFADRVLGNMQVVVHEFTNTRQVRPFVKPIFSLMNQTYTDIYGFTKISEEEAQEFADRFLPLLNPKLIKILTDDAGQVVAFVIAMPNINPGIKKARGRLFPLGWYHIWRSFRNSKRLVLLLGAVQKEMQNKGLDALLAVRLIGSALELGFTEMDSHLVMRDNLKMRRVIERISQHKMYKQYTIYSKLLKLKQI